MFFLTMNRRRFYLVVVAERFCRRYAKARIIDRGGARTIKYSAQ